MNIKEAFRQINILYFSLLAGQILFCLFILFGILEPDTRQSGWPPAPFGLIVPLFFAAIIPTAFLVNKNRLANGSAEPDFTAKLNHYRSVVIIRSALIESTNLFCLVILLLENNMTYLLFFAAGMMVFLYFRPSLDEFVQHYQLSSAEKGQLVR